MNRLVLESGEPGATISRYLYGQFAEHLGTGIYEGIWVGGYSPIPNTRGIRNDIVAALKKMGTPCIRWPGGSFAETYHWRNGIGQRGVRPAILNARAGGVPENNHFGTHEFLDLCEQVGADPYICGNLGSGTVQEMSDWVTYLTAPAKSPPGQTRWENGRAEPWPIKWWGFGNENWGSGGHMRAEHYAAEFRRYQTFCRHQSGGPLFRIACGHDEVWNDILLRDAGDYIDGLSLHHHQRIGERGRSGDPAGFTLAPEGTDTGFGEGPWWETLQQAWDLDGVIRGTLDILDKHDPDQRIGLVIDEWGTWHLEPALKPPGAVLYQQNTIRDAIAAAMTLNIFHSHAARIVMANIAQMVNVLQAMILTDGPLLVLTPTYHVFEMNKVHHDATLIPSELSCEFSSDAERSFPVLSASASRNAAQAIHLTLTNAHPDQAAPITCEMGAATATLQSVSARVLTAPALDTHNTFAQPDAVTPQPFKNFRIEGKNLVVELPPRSVVVLAVE